MVGGLWPVAVPEIEAACIRGDRHGRMWVGRLDTVFRPRTETLPLWETGAPCSRDAHEGPRAVVSCILSELPLAGPCGAAPVTESDRYRSGRGGRHPSTKTYRHRCAAHEAIDHSGL